MNYTHIRHTISQPYLADVSEAWIEYLYTERKVLSADEEVKRCKARLWSVDDGEVYFKLFSKPVSAVEAFADFMRTARYGPELDEIPEKDPLPLYPEGFIVKGWDARRIRRSQEDREDGILEELRDWNCWLRPFRERPEPRYALLAAVWFPVTK